jgi:hypothetical protein
MVVGGPTAVLDLGGLRIVSDPTFDWTWCWSATTTTPITWTTAAAILGAATVIPAHYDGWAHFSEGRDDLARAFDEAGQLRLRDHGTWIPLMDGAG